MCLTIGCDDYLQLPADAGKLIAKIHENLEMNALCSELQSLKDQVDELIDLTSSETGNSSPAEIPKNTSTE